MLQLILREGAMLTATGPGLGLLLAILVGRLAKGFLYEVSALDPVVFTVAPTLLALAALLACCIPARRAAKVGPTEALRYE